MKFEINQESLPIKFEIISYITQVYRSYGRFVHVFWVKLSTYGRFVHVFSDKLST